MASLVSDTIENLFNGVSQQPDSLRAKNQCEAAQNCHFSLVEGMQKRPPAEHVAYLSATSDPDAKIHVLQLSADETYIMRLTATSLEMSIRSRTTAAACSALSWMPRTTARTSGASSIWSFTSSTSG